MDTGSVNAAGSITSRDIITGLKIDKIEIVLNSVDQLSQVLAQAGSGFRQAGDDGPLEVLVGDQAQLTLPPNWLAAFKQLPHAADLSTAERCRAYAAWLVTRRPSRPLQGVAAREHYVPLTGRLSWDWQEDSLQPQLSYLRPSGEGPERRFEREPLADVTAGVNQFPAFVLLGPPGSGKSTVLERLVYTSAADFLRGASRRLPLWVTLAGYRWPQQSPQEFIQAEWAAKAAGSLSELARSGQILLLLDGLNEMPRLEQPDDRASRAAAWQHWLDDHFADESPLSSRAVIASRDAADYEQRLGLPRVELDALAEAQIEQFAGAYLGEDAGAFLAELHRLDLHTQAANPFALFILTQQYRHSQGQLAANRGRLFADYAAGLLSTQYPFKPRERRAALLALAHLGYNLQERGESQVLPGSELIALLPPQVSFPREPAPVPTPPVTIFNQTCRAGLLSLVDEDKDTYKFSHQLLQEQFAAQHLLARWQAGEDQSALWHVPRTQADMPDPQIGAWDPLPPPPPTGWEQTTILAAGLTERPDAFIQTVLAANPALAGRCLVEGGPRVSPETRAAVQQALLRDLSDPDLHRRARIQAGRVLSQVSDPRLEPVTINGIAIILPDLVAVPGGTATLGSAGADAYDHEQPVHQVDIAPFYLARYPVTNAEYRCFIRAGGYDVEDYWTPAGWQWRQGQGDTSGAVEQIMDTYRNLVQNPDLLEEVVKEGRLLPDAADAWRSLISLAETQARQRVSGWYPVQAHHQPYYWDDPAYNSDNQPVVGVTWYEAMAYCVWLNEQLVGGRGAGAGGRVSGARGRGAGAGGRGAGAGGQSGLPSSVPGLPPEVLAYLISGAWQVRLPTEAEWEWAAGGPGHSRYPWGPEFDPDRANTLEGRVLGTSPVGAYPAGAAVGCGALDMAGNMYEWTHSLYQPYPYRAGVGREDEQAGGRRTVRGGSWDYNARYARVSYRSSTPPVYFSSNNGFRVSVAPVLS